MPNAIDDKIGGKTQTLVTESKSDSDDWNLKCNEVS